MQKSLPEMQLIHAQPAGIARVLLKEECAHDSEGMHQSTLQHVCMPKACSLDILLQAECNKAMRMTPLQSAQFLLHNAGIQGCSKISPVQS